MMLSSNEEEEYLYDSSWKEYKRRETAYPVTYLVSGGMATSATNPGTCLKRW